MSPEPTLRLVQAREPDDVDELVGRVARGDAAAFERLYDVVGGQVFGLARRVVRDPERAQDVTQDVFLDVWRKAPGYDAQRGSARTWIMTITHRRAVDAVRRNETHKKQDGRALVDEVRHEEALDGLIRAEEHSAVRTCLETLTELQLESVRLAYFSGYTYAQVAAVLDKPLPTIKTRMRDGLIRLRDCLETAR